MTYKELLEELQQLSEKRLKDTITVFDPYTEEYTACIDIGVAVEDEKSPDPGRLVLVMKA